MRNIVLPVIALFLLIISCKKDEECNPGHLTNNVIGEWSVAYSSLTLGDIKFEANGTLVDVNNVLFAGGIGGGNFDEKSYIVNSDSSFTVKAVTGPTTYMFDFIVTNYTCDEIDANTSGVEVKLTRN